MGIFGHSSGRQPSAQDQVDLSQVNDRLARLESALASLAHNCAPDACWSTVSPPAWSGCGSEFRSTLTSLTLKPSFAMLAMISRAVVG